MDQHLAVHKTDTSDEGIAYFYCNRSLEDHRNPDDALRSLVRQLSAGNSSERKDSLVSAVYNEWNEQKLKGFPSRHLSIEKCKEIFPELLKAYAQSTIIIDGLDECDAKTRQELISVLEDIVNGSESLVKIFIASRDDPDLKQQYQSGRNLQVSANHNQEDIKKYVRFRMESHKSFKVSDSTKDLILEKMSEKSQGM